MMSYSAMPAPYTPAMPGISRMSPLQASSFTQSALLLPQGGLSNVVTGNNNAPSPSFGWTTGKGALAGTVLGTGLSAALVASGAILRKMAPANASAALATVAEVTFMGTMKKMGQASLAGGLSGLMFGTVIGSVKAILTAKRQS